MREQHQWPYGYLDSHPAFCFRLGLSVISSIGIGLKYN